MKLYEKTFVGIEMGFSSDSYLNFTISSPAAMMFMSKAIQEKKNEVNWFHATFLQYSKEARKACLFIKNNYSLQVSYMTL